MLKNYLRISLRNILKHKAYSFINIFGLALGLTCSILILLYVKDELSYDRYHSKSDRIYRVTRDFFNQNGELSLDLARIAPPIGPLLKNNFPNAIEEVTRVLQDSKTLLKIDNSSFIESKFFWAEGNFFKIFDYEFIRGNPLTALKEPNTVILTESTAMRLFGSIDIEGKIINYEKSKDLKITGVIKDVPECSHFKFNFLASFSTLNDIIGEQLLRTNWGRNNYVTYVLVPKGFPIKSLEEKIPEFLDKHISQFLLERTGNPPSIAPSKTTRLHFQKITDIHLYSHLSTELEENGDINNVYLFSLISISILLIACINFMNLSTARSARRAKEIGMRKVLGAYRQQLIKQFLGESILFALISSVIAITIVEIILPWFNNFAGKKLQLNLFGDLDLILSLIVIVLFVGIISGSYPSFLLSSFKPTSILKGNQSRLGTSTFRNVLVVLQFTISIGLIICMGVVNDQVDFYKNKKLGYNKEHLVILPADPTMFTKIEEIKSELKENPKVKMVTSSLLVPTDKLLNDYGTRVFEGNKLVPLNFRLAAVEVDYDFLDTYEISLLAGRNFSRQFGTDDSTAYILNESAVKQMNMPVETAIGKQLQYGRVLGNIIGVVKDFNFESLHKNIDPIIILLTKSKNFQFTVRISSENIPETIDFLKRKWEEYRPEYPFEYSFLDDNFYSLYKSEQKLGEIFGLFSLLAIIIACLGLFGLASFTAEQRTKEIGIRKTLGATVSGIVLLFTKDFIKLLIVANVIAWPLAYFAMHKWLEKFAFRTSIALTTFILAGALAFLISLFTIAYQAIKAALSNPIKSLKYE